MDTKPANPEDGAVLDEPATAVQSRQQGTEQVTSTQEILMKKLILVTSLALALAGSAQAHSVASELSAMSMLPVALSVAAPLGLLSAGAVFTVVAVEAVSEGTVWVLERASDGARASVTLSGAAAGGVSLLSGAAVVATAFSAGWVLSAAGKAVAFIPNEVGKALLYSERITR